MTKNSKRVRIQIQIDTTYLKEINELAERLDKSQNVMTELLLEAALDSRKRIADWVSTRLMGTITKKIQGKRFNKSGDKVYIQVMVNQEIAQELEQMAEEMDQTCSRFGAFLLKCAIEDNDWIIRIVTAPRAKKLINGFSKKKYANKEIMQIIQ